VAERSDELASEKLLQDIERTRLQMSGTIDAIQERLSPSRILHDATTSVRQAGADSVRRALSHAGRTAGQAREASAAAAGYARSHPLPAALVLGGLALVLLRAAVGRRRRRTRPTDGADYSQWDDFPTDGQTTVNDPHAHREFTDWAEPSNAARRTTSPVTNWFAKNPLAVGAAVAAAGTVVGVSWANQRSTAQGDESVRR
jgi:hypothetical protein